MADEPVLDPDTERRVAGQLYNHVWDLLETSGRTPVQDEDLINAAHASRWHWGVIGGPEQRIVGDWQVSRAYASVGRGEAAVHHARLAVQACDEFADAPSWLPASVCEGMARAMLAAGDPTGARAWYDRAQDELTRVTDVEDRELVAGQLAELVL